jgi:hypothetical protein
MNFKKVTLLFVALLFPRVLEAQRLPAADQANVGFPGLISSDVSGLRLIKFSGVLSDPNGQPLMGTIGVTFAIYKDAQGGAPLWLETQNIQPGPQGTYSALLGVTTGQGFPIELLSTNEPRWLGIQAQVLGSQEQPRLLLVGVPYALKAADADTLAGKPLSAFVMTDSLTNKDAVSAPATESGTRPVSRPRISGSDAFVSANSTGNMNYLCKFGSNVANDPDPHCVNSVIYDNGNIGIGMTNPSYQLDVYDAGNHAYATRSLAAGGSSWAGFFNNFSGAGGSLAASGGVYGTTNVGGGGSVGVFGEATNGGIGGYFTSTAGAALVTGNGNVGMGTTSPSYKLDVYDPGNHAYVTRSLAAGGNSWAGFFKNFSGGGGSLGTSGGIYGTTNVGGGTSVGVYGEATNGGIGGYFTSTGGAALVTGSGNVGIGTTAPTSRLHVVGAAKITGDVSVDGNIAAKYQDVAEWVEAESSLAPGTVVVIDPENNRRVRASGSAYDIAVVGAVSPQPGLILGEAGPNKVMVSQSGRVRIKVDASYGPIRPGDLLVTSPTPGHAMRSEAVQVGGTSIHRPGTLLGKALESWSDGQGEILVLLTLQ